MGKVYAVEVVKSKSQGQLFPVRRQEDLDTQMKTLKLISMFKDAFLDFGNSFLEHGKTFKVSFGFVFGQGEEISYAVGTDVSADMAERWRSTLEKSRRSISESCGYDYEHFVKIVDITINEKRFRGYFEQAYHGPSLEIVEEVIHEVMRALKEQEQPIAEIF